MKISPGIDADSARWWRPKDGIDLAQISGVANGKAEIELCRSEHYRLTFTDTDAEFCEFDDTNGYWLVSKVRGFNELEWWESSVNVVDWYDPFQKPEMFQEFLFLKPTSKEFLKFALKYGFLGGETWAIWLNDKDVGYGESLSYWRMNHEVLLAIRSLWESVKNRDSQAIASTIFFDTDRTFFSEEIQSSLETVMPLARSAEAPFTRGTSNESEADFWLRAGRELLLFATSGMLHQHCRPWLKIASAPQLRLIPVTLLGSMYVILAEEILGKSLGTYRCKGCGVQFPAYHRKRQYCSDACKARAYRARQEKVSNG